MSPQAPIVPAADASRFDTPIRCLRRVLPSPRQLASSPNFARGRDATGMFLLLSPGHIHGGLATPRHAPVAQPVAALSARHPHLAASAVGSGTGVLVGPHHVVTIRHVAEILQVSQSQGMTAAVSFAYSQPLQPGDRLPAWRLAPIHLQPSSIDGPVLLALLESPPLQPALVMPAHTRLRLHAPLYAVSHLLSAPKMLVHGGWRGHRIAGGFRTNLAGASGSSGSPVFCAATHHLVGLYRAARIAPGESLLSRLLRPCWVDQGEVTALPPALSLPAGTPSTSDPDR